ncbi:MAG: AAA family ATPase [Acidobacteria bacterium]|nr:AAA family ATPase [Acidobacteriota bacterium]
MYEDYYRFRRQPFSPTPDPEFLYKSETHQKALEELLRGVRRREGMLLLTGGVGTGKTTTTRALLGLLDRDVFTALVINPFVTADELLRVLLTDFGVVSDSALLQGASRQRLVDTLNRFLLSLSSVGASALAVIDEAQNLDPAVLEQLRILTGLETDQQKLLQILLVGQPELQALLVTPEMRPLNQRIGRRATLSPLNREEVERYVGFRVQLARGAGNPLFSQDALDQVYACTGGIPREINQLCDRSLESGFAAQRPTVDRATVAEAAAALGFSSPAAAPAVVESLPDADSSPVGQRSRITPKTKRVLATAFGLAAGVGIGAWVAVTMPTWLGSGVTPGGAPPAVVDATPSAPSLAAAPSEAPQGGQAYRVMAARFDARRSADALAERLRRLGGAVSVAPPAGPDSQNEEGYLVWVGPYTTLTAAQAMDTAIRNRFGLDGTRIVADAGPSTTPP